MIHRIAYLHTHSPIESTGCWARSAAREESEALFDAATKVGWLRGNRTRGRF